MSKDARRLRDDVYELVFKTELPKIDFGKKDIWLEQLKAGYDPLNFERAILFDYQDRIFEAVLRRTSKKFADDTDAEKKSGEHRWDHEKGTVARSATRNKDIDWLEVAKFADWQNIWHECIEFHKANPSIAPGSFDASLHQFRPMYELFVGWMYTDFNRASLLHIFNMSNHYALDFVKECMDMVEDPRKREPAYLLAIIQKEHKILQVEINENDEIDEFSKRIINACVDFVDHHEPVNFNEFEKEFQEHMKNHEEFNKVKLS